MNDCPQKTWSVYVHIFPNDKKYVGITGRPVKERWKNGSGYHGQVVGNAIKKYGWENITHEILHENCTFQQAAVLQRKYIQEFKSYDTNHGYNFTLGGQGYTKPDTQKIYKYSPTGKFIKEFKNSKVAKQQDNIPDSSFYSLMRGKTKSTHGYVYTTEYLGQYMDPIEYITRPKVYFDPPVSAYDRNGVKVETFYDSSEAAEKLGAIPRDILSVCEGKRFTSGGYIWRYGDAPTIQITEQDINRIGLLKQIYQYTLDGEFVKKYDSIANAHKSTGVNPQSISTCARGKSKTAGRFIWTYEYMGDRIPPINSTYLGVFVYKYGLDGKYICEYPSLANAAKQNDVHPNSIRQCCESNKNKEKEYSTIAKGFIWSYEKKEEILPSRRIKKGD